MAVRNVTKASQVHIFQKYFILFGRQKAMRTTLQKLRLCPEKNQLQSFPPLPFGNKLQCALQ
jgi:hypothetical protein